MVKNQQKEPIVRIWVVLVESDLEVIMDLQVQLRSRQLVINIQVQIDQVQHPSNHLILMLDLSILKLYLDIKFQVPRDKLLLLQDTTMDKLLQLIHIKDLEVANYQIHQSTHQKDRLNKWTLQFKWFMGPNIKVEFHKVTWFLIIKAW